MSLCWTQSVAGERLPAVSDLNGKFNAGGGSLDGNGVYFFDAAIAAPLGDQVGLQVDGIAGALDGDGFGGGAAHLFWRDPAVGLVGAYGSGFANTARVNYTVGNVGAEGALYLDRFSLEGTVGAQFSDARDTDVFGTASIAIYPTDNLRVYGGYRYWFGDNAAATGAEWLLPARFDNSLGFSLFADARFRENETFAFGGLRVYFGSGKSLIRRHREDDPGPMLPEDLFTIDLPAAGPPPPQDGVGCPRFVTDCPEF